jgi:hypothetical protein
MEGGLFGSHGGRLDIALAGNSALSTSGSGANSTEDTGPDPLIGTEIAGRYRVNERLGAGGMGRVYRAFDRVEQRDVAIKLLRPELTHDDRQVQRMRREFLAVSRLSHPGCVTEHITRLTTCMAAFEAAGFAGMRSWLKRMREAHGV